MVNNKLNNSNLMKDLSNTEIDFETWFKEHKNDYKVDKFTKTKYALAFEKYFFKATCPP